MQPIVPIGPLWGDNLLGGNDNGETAGETSNQFILGILILCLFAYIMTSWESWREAHDRQARLNAYRRRQRWRRADVPRLLELGIPEHRIERIIDANKRRGRGVVQRYQSLDTMMTEMAERFGILLSPETSPHARLATLKQMPFWSEVVEALYRGEHAAAKDMGIRSPSRHAESVVAACLGISDASVHKICAAIRKARKLERTSSDPSFLLRVSEFEIWKSDGNLQAV